MTTISRENNFDLIRLFAATQVVFWHTREHLNLSSRISLVISEIISFFPGVPIFFTVNGFLIYASFERNSSMPVHLKNRCLRIFPGLWFIFLFTLAILLMTGYVNDINLLSKQFLAWAITQVTIFQFYIPQLLRGYGVGTPNGSLWKIFIEFSFYLFLPLFFWIGRKMKVNKVLLLLSFIGLSILYNVWYKPTFKSPEGDESSIIKLLLWLNLLPYLFYFLGGSLIYNRWDRIKQWYIGKGFYWLVIYVIYCISFSSWLHLFRSYYWPNIWGLISIALLMQVVISLAYMSVTLSNKLLNHNDISYGLYLFHMPIISLILFYHLENKSCAPFTVVGFVFLLVCVSWILIEKPALSSKIKRGHLKCLNNQTLEMDSIRILLRQFIHIHTEFIVKDYSQKHTHINDNTLFKLNFYLC